MALNNLTAEAAKLVPQVDVATQIALFAQSKPFLGMSGASLMMIAALAVVYLVVDFQSLSRR